MIETGCPTRIYYVTIGSFDTPDSASFDTHVDELAKHRELFTELGQGLRSFAAHLRSAGQFERVLLLTFSDFGRQVAENKTHGTDHGDASLLFVVGGRGPARAAGHACRSRQGPRWRSGRSIDFRQIYANVLEGWLHVDLATILGEGLEPFPVTLSRSCLAH